MGIPQRGSTDLVSVVVPTYNVGSVVRDAVESVLAQTYARLEVIVVDDGSTDDTMRSLDGLEDPRLTIVSKPNGGVSSARNLGTEMASGPFLAFLDADDLWDAEKLERTLPLMEGRVAVGSMMRYVDEVGASLGSAAGEDPTVGDAPERIRAGRLMPFPLSGIVMRADAVEAAGPYDTELRYAQDLDFFARVARQGEIGWIAEPLGAYRLSPNAASARAHARQRKNTRFIQARLARRDEGGDLTWEEFEQLDKPSFATRRRDYAAAAYREGGLALSQGRRLGAWRLVAAAAVSPRYTFPRLRRHLAART
ncbi:glycosyltransferase family 2 protein [Demequina zhanjiangensis]|uniref:Glycosyltransferase n=1 Tax=Demequina zhanjiangensis TaxID=3051659 RepID=A0ABT8FYS8_9MICO|nr:glycosyltransferase [Demequina sp. SYSU T00b26]MDN4472045.1 glycosyltransferase [Demequina sp. SYSU T00b26]